MPGVALGVIPGVLMPGDSMAEDGAGERTLPFFDFERERERMDDALRSKRTDSGFWRKAERGVGDSAASRICAIKSGERPGPWLRGEYNGSCKLFKRCQ